MHVAVLSAIFPLGGMIAAPFAGALADRYRFQLFLFFAVLALAASTALTGATSLVVLYGLRAVAGLAFGAIVPLCLLVGHQVACDPHEKAGLFTMLTASLFLGDFAGPLLAEGSARILPEHAASGFRYRHRLSGLFGDGWIVREPLLSSAPRRPANK
jgi:MFS family permease